jgi:hypothetical protein
MANGTPNDRENWGILNVENNSYVELNGGITGYGTLNITSQSRVIFGRDSDIGKMYINTAGEAVLASSASLKGGEIII